MLGSIHFVDDRLKNFNEHPFFHAGTIRLQEVIDKPEDTFITLNLRLRRRSHDSFWRVLVLEVCSHGKSYITLSVGVRLPVPSDWEELKIRGYKGNPSIAAVYPDSVGLSVQPNDWIEKT